MEIMWRVCRPNKQTATIKMKLEYYDPQTSTCSQTIFHLIPL